jgi:hypothetical protein
MGLDPNQLLKYWLISALLAALAAGFAMGFVSGSMVWPLIQWVMRHVHH